MRWVHMLLPQSRRYRRCCQLQHLTRTPRAKNAASLWILASPRSRCVDGLMHTGVLSSSAAICACVSMMMPCATRLVLKSSGLLCCTSHMRLAAVHAFHTCLHVAMPCHARRLALHPWHKFTRFHTFSAPCGCMVRHFLLCGYAQAQGPEPQPLRVSAGCQPLVHMCVCILEPFLWGSCLT